MGTVNPIRAARTQAGLSQAQLAARAGTSRPTLSAYEHGRTSPTLETLSRVLAAAGFSVSIEPIIEFLTVSTTRGRTITLPSRLPRLPIDDAVATVTLPLHLNWSDPDQTFHLADRNDRARVYETVLREGTADDILQYIDGALLVDIWNELILPREVRAAWAPLINPHRHDGTRAAS